MSLNSHVIILPRHGENRIAIVKCDYRGSLTEAMGQIVKAVTKWVKETDAGQVAWAGSCEDLNIADLESIIFGDLDTSINFCTYLNEFEVYNLDIELFGDSDCPVNYTYDTVLVEGL